MKTNPRTYPLRADSLAPGETRAICVALVPIPEDLHYTTAERARPFCPTAITFVGLTDVFDVTHVFVGGERVDAGFTTNAVAEVGQIVTVYVKNVVDRAHDFVGVLIGQDLIEAEDSDK